VSVDTSARRTQSLNRADVYIDHTQLVSYCGRELRPTRDAYPSTAAHLSLEHHANLR
jgi:hypothetical protein